MLYGILILGGMILTAVYYGYRQSKEPGYDIFPRNKFLGQEKR
ncbi:MAG: hypothetical protein ACPL5F_02865 [Moorellaceae bacterium]